MPLQLGKIEGPIQAWQSLYIQAQPRNIDLYGCSDALYPKQHRQWLVIWLQPSGKYDQKKIEQKQPLQQLKSQTKLSSVVNVLQNFSSYNASCFQY